MKVAPTKLIDKTVNWNPWLWFRSTGSEIDRMLVLSMAFSIALVTARILYTDRLTFIFMNWNLFLAWLPYMISSWLQKRPQLQARPVKFATISFVWLLFIPNSFYILTDLFHLGKHKNVPNWFDLAMIISFAWNGLLLGILSVRQMEKMIQPYLPGRHELLFIYPIMFLNALGVYMGRYPRFNSWNIITNPLGVVAYLGKMFLHPVQHVYAWGMVACFSVFMTLVYLTLKKLHKAIH
ncbi:DUF1361 domain-containing protein [Longitalea luteola]|uniref:DUF1361 domain-containing protein n=1 Tax=Longitalea luteola TaxID=2812563 RepID=UPI001A970820|nr:DUF1361 domain-containing protein [Longitalea luteola]